ncbi:MAG: hypothetical protein BACD_02591 [Bacteroides rodentium]
MKRSSIFTRSTMKTLALGTLWIVAIMAVMILINIAGIVWLGDIQSWESWLKNSAPLFLVWRLLLYAATIYGWLWMRKRLLQREPDATKKLRRAEICAAASIILLEVTNALAQ